MTRRATLINDFNTKNIVNSLSKSAVLKLNFLREPKDIRRSDASVWSTTRMNGKSWWQVVYSTLKPSSKHKNVANNSYCSAKRKTPDTGDRIWETGCGRQDKVDDLTALATGKIEEELKYANPNSLM